MTKNTCVAKITVEAGTTILIPSGSIGDHLFVSVFEIKEIDGINKVLLVPFETQVQKCETTCTLSAGEHSFIKHDSFVGYSHCRSEPLAHVIASLQSGTFKIKHPPVSQNLLSRIKAGYLQSKRVPKYIKAEWG